MKEGEIEQFKNEGVGLVLNKRFPPTANLFSSPVSCMKIQSIYGEV